MKFHAIFLRLLFFTVIVSALTFIPYTIISVLHFGQEPAMILLVFIPMFGTIYSLPAILVSTFLCLYMTKRKKIYGLWPYMIGLGGVSTIVTGAVFYLLEIVSLDNLPPLVFLFLGGCFVGFLFAGAVQKSSR